MFPTLRRAITHPDSDQRAFVIPPSVDGVVTAPMSRERSLAFAVPVGMAVAALALLTDLRRGQDWYGDLWVIVLRDLGAGIVIGAMAYVLQRCVEGWWPDSRLGRLKNWVHHRVSHWWNEEGGPNPSERPRRRAWHAVEGVALARTWTLLVAWGWLMQLRTQPDRAVLALGFVVVAHIAFAAAVPLGGFLRRVGTPQVGDGGRAAAWLSFLMVAAYWLGIALLFFVLRQGLSTGGAQVSVPIGFGITVQPTELARPLFLLAFAAAISGARVPDDLQPSWWNKPVFSLPIRRSALAIGVMTMLVLWLVGFVLGFSGPLVLAAGPIVGVVALGVAAMFPLRDGRRIRGWWHRRLPWLGVPLSTVTLISIVAFSSAFLFWRLDDLSPYLVMTATLVLVVALTTSVTPVARVVLAALLGVALVFGLQAVNTGLDSVPFLPDQLDKLSTRIEAAEEPILVDDEGTPAAAFAPQQPQLGQALIAASRGLYDGVGVGNGIAGDVVPAARDDFVLSVISEEWGLVGLILVVALYGALLWRALGAAVRSSSGFGQTLATAIVVGFAAQLLFVLAGMGRKLPHGGVTVPMLSAGGSSLIVTGLLFGTIVGTSAVRVDDNEVIPVSAGRSTGLARRVRFVRGVAVVAWPVICLYCLVYAPQNAVDEAERDLAAADASDDRPLDAEDFLTGYERRHSVRRPTIRTYGEPAVSEEIAVTSADPSCGGYRSPSPGPFSFGSSSSTLVRCYPDGSLYSDVLGHYSPRGGRVRALEDVVGRLPSCEPPDGLARHFIGSTGCGAVDDVPVTVVAATQERAAELLAPTGLTEAGLLPEVAGGAEPPPTVAATIVSDPTTGNVEALTATPAFDPNPRARPGAEAASEADQYTLGDAAADLLPGTAGEPEPSELRRLVFAASQGYGYSPVPGLPLAEGEVNPITGARVLTDSVSRYFRFPLGSTMKLMTSVAVLEASAAAAEADDGARAAELIGEFEPTDRVVGVGNEGRPPCGGTWQEMLIVSCNSGFAELALLVEREPLRAMAETFGLTGDVDSDRLDGLQVEFPSESFVPYEPDPTLDDLENQFEERRQLARNAIGLQGVQASVVDVAGMVNAIAAGGVRMPWRLLPGNTDAECAQRLLARLAGCDADGERVTTDAIAESVWEAMERVVADDAGTAHGALSPLLEEYADRSIELGAKTGSASAQAGTGEVGWCVAIARWDPDGADGDEPEQVRSFVTVVQAPSALGLDGSGVCNALAPLIREVVGR